MNFGLAISWRGATIDSTRAICLEADRLGFDYFWITEAWGLESLSTAGYLLGISSRLKIGIGVLNVFSRSAAVIGMACATLDQISGERFLLGIGTSGKTLVENWHGASFDLPMKRTREYVDVIRKVARGEIVDFPGDTMKLSGFKLYTKAKETSQEIYLGAMGDRNLKLAGEIGDGAIVTMYPISALSRAVELVRKGDSSDRKKVFSYLHLKITMNSDETEKARLEVARNIAFYVASMGAYYAKNLCNLGLEKNVKKIVEAHSVAGSKSAVEAVDDKLIDELALIGDIEDIREKLSKIPDGVVPVFVLEAPLNLKIPDLKLDQLKLLME
ncbi:MAG: LLM class flavin-dependent oxidoreductase [Thaumarchaeota archaeon]|nr:LLM class flavin-dependent oxidoreductase [Nitrososphaerota archaeon]